MNRVSFVKFALCSFVLAICLAHSAAAESSYIRTPEESTGVQVTPNFTPPPAPQPQPPIQTTAQPTMAAPAAAPQMPTQYVYAPPSQPKDESKLAAKDRSLTAATRSGLDLGLQFSHYKYREPGVGVTLEGNKYGALAEATGVLPRNFFLIGSVRYAGGDSDYTGSGKHANNPEDLWELRGLVGRDFMVPTSGTASVDLSPYSGLGYRTLYSDERGMTSTGAFGYRRDNRLFYLPLGVKPRIGLSPDSRITSTFEYDYLIRGYQDTTLSDVPGYPNLSNTQTGGYGLRGDVMWESKSWALGPFINYWDIDQSSRSCGTGTAFFVCGVEPHNHTVEYGLQFKYHLF